MSQAPGTAAPPTADLPAPIDRPPSPPSEPAADTDTDTARTEPERDPPYREINPFGDVRLSIKAKDDSCDFRVVSQQLIAASHFFRQLLGPDSEFKEAVEFRGHRVLGPFKLEVTIDDYQLQACESILRVIHGLTSVGDVEAGEGDINDMYEMAKLTQYFDCGAALRPWAMMAIPDLFDGDDVTDINEMDKWIFIAWVMRLAGCFENITQFCVKHGRRSRSNAPFKIYIGQTGPAIVLKLAPQKVTDAIIELCGALARMMAVNIMDKIAEYQTQSDNIICKKNERGCYMIVLGTLHCFTEIQGISRWLGDEWLSPTNLTRMVGVKLPSRQGKAKEYLGKYPSGHQDCDPYDAIIADWRRILDGEEGLDIDVI